MRKFTKLTLEIGYLDIRMWRIDRGEFYCIYFKKYLYIRVIRKYRRRRGGVTKDGDKKW